MKLTFLHRARKRLAQAWRRATRSRRCAAVLPLIALGLGCMLTAGALSSCGGEQPWNRGPVVSPGVPDIRVRLTPAAIALAELSTTGGYDLRVDNRPVAQSPGPMPGARVTRSGRTWRFGALSVEGNRAALEAAPGGFVRFNQVKYRGRFLLLPSGEEGIVVVNQLDVENYLAGVLPKELRQNWSLQTYRALAVAARTFALYQMTNASPSREYDVAADQSSQVYGGASAETEVSRRAVQDTRGWVLTYGPLGSERIFLVQYSACCGGTVNTARVIRDAEEIPPLIGGQACDDCQKCPYYRWPPVRVSKADIARAVAAAYPNAADLGGTVARIEVADSTSYGRALWLHLFGPNEAKVRLRADDLRLALLRSGLPGTKKLYSMNCQIRDAGDCFEFYDGRGHGHGVGLCQWGAQGKSEKGMSGEDILNFYYPGAKIVRAY